ncbi:MAG: YraN family protein [Chloroflexi bacterium]|nr:YraN family protein [Chloroflexota bacterium]
MTSVRRGLGDTGESLAARELARRGLTIVARNWRCAQGEIDLIARDGDTLAIVEVRTRRGRTYGTPEESITPTKQARLIQLAQMYVAEIGWEGPWRIDVVAIELDRGGRLLRITHLPGAIEG